MARVWQNGARGNEGRRGGGHGAAYRALLDERGVRF